MSERSKDEAELAEWNTDVAPGEWVRDREWSHPDPEFGPALAAARRQTEAAYAIVKTLAELRRAAGLNQTEFGSSAASAACRVGFVGGHESVGR